MTYVFTRVNITPTFKCTVTLSIFPNLLCSNVPFFFKCAYETSGLCL